MTRPQRRQRPGAGAQRNQARRLLAARVTWAHHAGGPPVLGPQPRLAAHVVECREQLFGARISSDTVDAILTRVADALADPDADLLKRVRAAKAIDMGETGWRTAGDRRALWGAFSDRHAIVGVRDSRHEDHAKELLGDTTAIRHSASNDCCPCTPPAASKHGRCTTSS